MTVVNEYQKTALASGALLAMTTIIIITIITIIIQSLKSYITRKAKWEISFFLINALIYDFPTALFTTAIFHLIMYGAMDLYGEYKAMRLRRRAPTARNVNEQKWVAKKLKWARNFQTKPLLREGTIGTLRPLGMYSQEANKKPGAWEKTEMRITAQIRIQEMLRTTRIPGRNSKRVHDRKAKARLQAPVVEDASDSECEFEHIEPARNLRPNVEKGEKWLEPIPVEAPVPVPAPVPVAAPIRPTEAPVPVAAPIRPIEAPAPVAAPIRPIEAPVPVAAPIRPIEAPVPVAASSPVQAAEIADCCPFKRKADSGPTETARLSKRRKLTSEAVVSSSAKAKVGDWDFLYAPSEPVTFDDEAFAMPTAHRTEDKRKADSDPTEDARPHKQRKLTSTAVVSSSAKAKIGDWNCLHAPPMPVTIEGLEGEEDDDDSATCEYVATLDNYDFEENDQDDLPSEPSTTNEATTGEATVEEEPTREENQEALVQRAPATPTRRARRTQVEILVEDASRFVTSSVELGSGISMDGRRFSRRVASRNA